MANISHFTQTVNGISTTYDIHDADAVHLGANSIPFHNAYPRCKYLLRLKIALMMICLSVIIGL